MELSQENFILLIVSGSIVFLMLAVSLILLTARNFKSRMKHQSELFRLVLEAQEKERHRISRDLHDGIGPDISSIKLIASSIKTTVKEENALIETLVNGVDNTLASIRNIIRNLRPHEFSKLGLTGALTNLKQNIENTSPINISFEFSGMDERLTDVVEVNIYRIIQELVNNSMKHSEAKNITLSMKMNDQQLSIDYNDNGKGFDAEKITPGMGLGNIKARVELFGGKMQMSSSPGKGIHYKINFLKDKLNI